MQKVAEMNLNYLLNVEAYKVLSLIILTSAKEYSKLRFYGSVK